MKYDLVIFDLDGTLLNTLEDLTAATNHALVKRGMPPRSLEDVRRFIGNGVARLMKRSAPEGTDDATLEALLADFKAYYKVHVNDRTVPYPGVPGMLQALKDVGIRTCINSNKLDSATQQLWQAHFSGLVDVALGERQGIPKKPAPDGAFQLMNHFGAAASRTIYVGDGDADLQTAENAGIDCAWVSWGFRRPEEVAELTIPHRFDDVDSLCRFLLED